MLLLATPVGAQQAEAPTWSVGDSWALGADDIDLSFTFDYMRLTCDVTGSGSSYVVYEVVEAGGDEYTVNAACRGELDLDMDIGGTLQGTQVSGYMNMSMIVEWDGTLYFTKDELALSRESGTVDLNMDMTGTVTGGGQTGDISMIMDLTGNMDITYSPPLDLFDFPIEVGETWPVATTVTITGRVSGNVSVNVPGESFSKPVSESLDESVDVSLLVECPGTEGIPTASTAYKLVMTGTGVLEAGLFMPVGTLYYSPDKGFIVASECDLSKAILLTQELRPPSPYTPRFTGADQTIRLNPVSVQEAKDVIEGRGEGISIMLIGVLIGVMVAILVILVALSRWWSRRASAKL